MPSINHKRLPETDRKKYSIYSSEKLDLLFMFLDDKM